MKKSILCILSFTIFFDVMGGTLIFPLIPFIIDYYFNGSIQNPFIFQKTFELCQSITQYLNPQNAHFLTKVLFGGILGSVYYLAQYFSAPICGKLSDKIGRKKVLSITLLGTSFCYLPWIFSKTFGGLILAPFLCGLTGGNISVAMAAFADISTRETRAKAMSINSVAVSLGFIFGPILGSLLAKKSQCFPCLIPTIVNPFYLVPLFALVLALLNFFLFISFFKETHTEQKDTKTSYKKNLVSLLFPKILPANNPPIRKANLIYLIFCSIFKGIDFTITFLAVERFGFSIGKNSVIFVCLRFVMVFTQAFLFPFSLRYIPIRTLLFFGITSASLAFFCTSFTYDIKLFFLCLIFMALSNGFVAPGMSTLISLYTADERQGYFLGLFRSAGALARMIAPMIAAILYFLFGARFYYLLGGIGLFIPLWLILHLPKPYHKHE